MTRDATNSDPVNDENLGDLNGENKTRSPWFKCFPEDWQKATRGLSLELRGAYFDCLCLIYETERPIPEDDNWMAHRLHISARLWRSVRDKLVACGKLVRCEGGWTNSRAESELTQRRLDRRTKSESAANRERTKRESYEKPSQINEPKPQEYHYARASQISDIRYQNQSPEKIASTEPEPASACEGLAGLNGAADQMISDAMRWMNVSDRSCAAQWLQTTIRIHGAPIVKAAYAKLGTDMAEGVVISRPLQTWAKIAQRMTDQAAAKKPIQKLPESATRAAMAEMMAELQGVH